MDEDKDRTTFELHNMVLLLHTRGYLRVGQTQKAMVLTMKYTSYSTGDMLGITIIMVGNEIGDLNSNPELGYLHFTPH